MKSRSEGEIIVVGYVRFPPQFHYWYETTADKITTPEMILGMWDRGELHGPFKSQAAAAKNSQKVLLGADCKITERGALH